MCQLNMFSPEEDDLLSVHPRSQAETRILSKGRNNQSEDQSDENKTGRKDDLGREKIR